MSKSEEPKAEAKHWKQLVEGEEVVVTEKIHGTNWNDKDSTLADHMMEGVVITPAVERTSMGMKRVYKLRHDGTELH